MRIGLRGGQRVHGQDAKRRRAIDEDVVVPVRRRDRRDRFLETVEVAVGARDVDFRAGEVQFGRHDFEPIDRRRFDELFQLAVAEEGLVNALALFFLDAEAAGRVGLRIKVDEQDFLSAFGEAGGEIDRRGRFPDAAFLVRERYDRYAHEWGVG